MKKIFNSILILSMPLLYGQEILEVTLSSNNDDYTLIELDKNIHITNAKDITIRCEIEGNMIKLTPNPNYGFTIKPKFYSSDLVPLLPNGNGSSLFRPGGNKPPRIPTDKKIFKLFQETTKLKLIPDEKIILKTGQIYNTMGQLVKNIIFEENYTIEIEELNSGVYFLVTQNQNNEINKVSFIKK